MTGLLPVYELQLVWLEARADMRDMTTATASYQGKIDM